MLQNCFLCGLCALSCCSLVLNVVYLFVVAVGPQADFKDRLCSQSISHYIGAVLKGRAVHLFLVLVGVLLWLFLLAGQTLVRFEAHHWFCWF